MGSVDIRVGATQTGRGAMEGSEQMMENLQTDRRIRRGLSWKRGTGPKEGCLVFHCRIKWQ